MSARWFRFYADAMRHPKVARLNDAQFRLWVELLSVAAENDGKIPPAENLKHMLKRRLDHLLRGLDDLIRASLIDPLDHGYEPHGWKKRQYKSDVSTDRVRKYRGKGNVSETAPEAETETDIPLSKDNGAAPDPKKIFWANAKTYLAPHVKGDVGARIGKWCKGRTQEQVAEAITASQFAGAVDPPTYIERVLRGATEEVRFTGPC